MGSKRARRRTAGRRVTPEPRPDPCACYEYCPQGEHVCLGGHALSPRLHLCAQMHSWGEYRW